MTRILLELWFIVYAVALLPSWVLAALITWRDSEKDRFVWVSPVGYARHSRSTLNAAIAMVLWALVIGAFDLIRSIITQ